MSIGEMCAEFDVTPRTLRFYEAKELLFPIRDGQKRLFTRRCRARLKLILQGKRFGFSPRGDPPAARTSTTSATRRSPRSPAPSRSAGQRLAAMEAQRDELTLAIADLREQLAWGEQTLAQRGLRRAAE